MSTSSAGALDASPAPVRPRLDVEFVRRQFPAFDHPETRDWTFMDNAGGTYACQSVLERLNASMIERKAQPYGVSALSQRAGEAAEEGYAAIAELLGTHADNLTLGPSTSINTYVLARALRHNLTAGDEIVVTNQDHEANIGSWRGLAESGVVVREWQVDEAGELRPRDLERLVNARTRLVCFSLCSNVIGSVNPLAEVVAIARRRGALVVGDGVSLAPHVLMDAEVSGLDFLLFSAYKIFGTHVGALWSSSAALAGTNNQGHFFNHDKPHYRLNPAGPQHAEIAALGGLRPYFDALYAHHFGNGESDARGRLRAVWGLIQAHEAALTARLIAGLRALRGLRIVGQSGEDLSRRVGVLSVVALRMPPSVVVRRLSDRRVAVRSGHFYAPRLLEALGIDGAEGVLRISLIHYNTVDDVDRLLCALGEIVA